MGARTDRFPLFDSMRALAALAVLLTHASFAVGLSNDYTSTLRPYTARLDVGVAVFFLISGFLLYRPFVKARVEGLPHPMTVPYFWRRFLRIFPAYWVALTVFALWIGPSDFLNVHDAAIYYGLGQIYRPEWVLGGLNPAWSLCVEVSFYIFLPVWAWAMRAVPSTTSGQRLRHEAIALAALFAVSLIYKLVAFAGPGDPGGPRIFLLPNFLDHFALGMGLAVASVWLAERRAGSPAPVRLVERWPSLSWLLALVAFWAVSTQIGLTGLIGERSDEATFILRHSLYGAVAFFLLLPAVFGRPEQGLVRRVLANPVLGWLGVISYSIFLWNPSALAQLREWQVVLPGDTLAFERMAAIAVAFTVAIAALSYYLIERPVLSLKRLVPDRRRSPAGAAPRRPRFGWLRPSALLSRQREEV